MTVEAAQRWWRDRARALDLRDPVEAAAIAYGEAIRGNPVAGEPHAVRCVCVLLAVLEGEGVRPRTVGLRPSFREDPFVALAIAVRWHEEPSLFIPSETADALPDWEIEALTDRYGSLDDLAGLEEECYEFAVL